MKLSHNCPDLAFIVGTANKLKLVRSGTKTGQVNDDGWRTPEPLSRSSVVLPYPLDALPGIIRNAVQEVQSFTQAPVAMVACSALTNLSLAGQAHYDVQRAENLTGPVSLYFIVMAESGERKTTCDNVFSKVLREYETQQQELAKPDVKQYESDKCAWEAIKLGVLEAIKTAARANKPTGQLEDELRRHEDKKPVAPRVPRLVYSDATPEALTDGLANKWPSGGVVSSEGGAVFGSHGMGKDSQVRNLAILNQLWDGARLTFDRKGGSYVVDGARLTMALQVQESVLLEFFKKTGTLARGTGFLARFLFAQPVSTQGTRFFQEPPKNTPALTAYNNEIKRILQAPVPINESGSLEPVILTLNPDAKTAWVRFHDEIEQALCMGGELQDIRDIASKISDNLVRLAALFHVVDGNLGAIGVSHIESASIIVAWHLNESLRFFGDLALPDELANASRLSDWLINYCKANGMDVVSTRTVSRSGPNQLRDKERRDAAIVELIDRGHIVLLKSGKKQEIQLNPQLLRA